MSTPRRKPSKEVLSRELSSSPVQPETSSPNLTTENLKTHNSSWTRYAPSTEVFAEVGTATFTADGKCVWNKDASEALPPSAEHVALHWDRERRLIGIEVVNDRRELPLRSAGNGRRWFVIGGFLRWAINAAVDPQSNRVQEGTIAVSRDEATGWFILDLNRMTFPQARRERRPAGRHEDGGYGEVDEGGGQRKAKSVATVVVTREAQAELARARQAREAAWERQRGIKPLTKEDMARLNADDEEGGLEERG